MERGYKLRAKASDTFQLTSDRYAQAARVDDEPYYLNVTTDAEEQPAEVTTPEKKEKKRAVVISPKKSIRTRRTCI